MFVDREEELSRLETLYDSDEPKLAVVYGRRRIGKTALVLESTDDRDEAVYHQAVETTEADQIEAFVEDVVDVYPDVQNLRKDWETVLGYLIDEDAIVVLDEFPYLVDGDESLPSRIQRLWDHETECSSATLVLTGSSVGMMYEIALGGGAPLYGRVSKSPNGRLELRDLGVGSASEFYPAYEPEETVMAYSVFGGVPHYLQVVDDSASLGENVTRSVLSPQGGLHDEPETVLRMELDEVNRYFAVLKAVAKGNRERNEISQSTGIESSDLSYYFERLDTLGFLRRDVPVTADPKKTKSTRYRMKDEFFRFWFRFVYGKESRYSSYGEGAYEDLIQPEMADFGSETFEELCHEAVPELYPSLNLVREPGRWWRKGREVDVVGLTDEDVLVLGEVKFTSEPLGYGVLSRLKEDAEEVERSAGGSEYEHEYALFSRSGFNRSVREEAEDRDDLSLFSVSDVLDALGAG
jgi:AAA+ ATPase superfamily predicted ATPase